MDYLMKEHDALYILNKFNEIKNTTCKYALIQINIKNFRYYNIKYGIEAGNEILHLVFQELKSFFSSKEYVGHMYSDNFAILAQYQDVEVLMRERIVSLVDGLYRIPNAHIFRNIFYSMGIFKIEKCSVSFDAAWNYANLCRKASEDLYKRNSCVEVYDKTFYENYVGQMELENNTAEAYKNYEFVTYLQPKVDLVSEEIVGAEALLRWFDEDGRSVSLYKFLPILNQNSYIILVDLDTFDQMCRYLDTRIKNKQKVVPISVNISKAHFYNPEILEDYISIFEKYDIPKNYIQMEFMESISLNDTKKMKKVISGFKEYGFTCVLDDFGNGYSSFNVLLNAPLDVIKMDRQFFLQNLNGDGRLVIKTVVDLIHSLKMKVVAEGVELEEHIDWLKECGCDWVQGYYYYKPMAMDEFNALLDKDGTTER